MEKKLHIDQVLFSTSDPAGLEKQKFLTSSRIICPNLGGTILLHRFTWERMNEEVENIPRRALAEMQKSKNGDQLAATYQALPLTSITQKFLAEIATRMLPSGLVDYDPTFGFDLEACILIPAPGKETVVLEIFPRTQKDVPSSAYGSLMRSAHAFVNLANPENFKDLMIGKFTVGESQVASEQAETMEKLNQWITNRGYWYVDDEDRIGIFLNVVALSFLEELYPGQHTIAASSAGKEIQGQRHTGDIVFTTPN